MNYILSKFTSLKSSLYLIIIILFIVIIKPVFAPNKTTNNDIQSVENQIDLFKKTQNKELHNVFKNLSRYTSGTNIVKKHVIESFEIEKDEIIFTFKYVNKFRNSPDFKIFLYNKYGKVLAEKNINWWFSEMERDEVIIEAFNIGIIEKPTYYRIRLN